MKLVNDEQEDSLSNCSFSLTLTHNEQKSGSNCHAAIRLVYSHHFNVNSVTRRNGRRRQILDRYISLITICQHSPPENYSSVLHYEESGFANFL